MGADGRLPPRRRRARPARAARRKGAPETFDGWGYLALLRRLAVETDHPVWAPGFERTLEQPLAGRIPVDPEVRLVVTEGNYLLLDRPPWPQVRAALSEVWYVEADAGVRLERLLARHVEFGKSPAEARAWVAAVDEPNAGWSSGAGTRADLVVRLVTAAQPRLHSRVTESSLMPSWLGPAQSRPREGDLADAADHLRPGDPVAGRGQPGPPEVVHRSCRR